MTQRRADRNEISGKNRKRSAALHHRDISKLILYTRAMNVICQMKFLSMATLADRLF